MDNQVGRLAVEVRDDCLKRDEIAMDVRNDRYAHVPGL
jgi:hypothetical protein